MMKPPLSQRPSGRLNNCIRKGREEKICTSIGRTRRKINLIREGKDSNLPSTKLSLIKINKISLLKMNPRDNTPLGKGKDHQSNVGDVKKIICTRISLTKERE